MVSTEPGGLDRQLGRARAMKSASCFTLQLLKNSGNARLPVLGGGGRRGSPESVAAYSRLSVCLGGFGPNLSLSAITQLELPSDGPHAHPRTSWLKPKLCPISWAMVEAKPTRLSW